MRLHPNTVLGAGCILFGAVVLFLWLPFDTETGFAFRKRGQWGIGDAMAPGFAAVVFILTGLLLVLGRKPDRVTLPDANHLRFVGALIALLAISLLVMRYAGPLFVSVAGGEEYRLLRDTVPYKYIGFALGGFGIVTGLVALVEGRLSRGAVITGAIAVALIIALYDLPFDDLLLPPNGDV